METKSRYEILKELNERKQGFMINKATLHRNLEAQKKALKQKKRELEDFEEDIRVNEARLPEEEKVYDTLIQETANSIDSLSRMQSQGK